MTDTPKYFIYPFGTAGDRATVPDPTQGSGVVSYQSGFPVGYQLVDTDPASLNIPRDEFNQLIYDITYAIQQIQQNGYPVFITTAMNDGSPFSYEKNSFVRASDGSVYYSLIDSNTDTPPSSNWQIVINGNGVGGSILTGMMIDYWGIDLPSGYVWANRQTIGNAASNSTGRANADTASLFSFFWTLSPSLFPMFTSTGTAQARGGSAAADYAANYAITLPDCLERSTIGAGTMGGVSDPLRVSVAGSNISGATLGASGGAQNVTLVTGNLAAHIHGSSGMTAGTHAHGFSTPDHTHSAGIYANNTIGDFLATQYTVNNAPNGPSYNFNTNAGGAFSGTTNNATPTVSGNTDSAGSGTPFAIMSPVIVCNKIIKL